MTGWAWFMQQLHWCWYRLCWVCCGQYRQITAYVDLEELTRLVERGRVPSDVPVCCCICDNLLCRDAEQYFDHVRGQKHRKHRRALMLDV